MVADVEKHANRRKPPPLVLLMVVLGILLGPGISSPEGATPLTGYGFLRTLNRLVHGHDGRSGAYVLEKGDEALLARAWMVNNAVETIDVLTFIWSFDNIGLIATDALLRAAERGVRVRILVDDMVLDEEWLDLLLALDAHPLFEIRIYNPVETVGVSTFETTLIFLTELRRFNHRLHNKSFLVDSIAGITGGRNVANEYFDYDSKYNFRDRDLLVIGPVVAEMGENFEAYWNFALSRPIGELLPERTAELTPQETDRTYAELHACAGKLTGELPLVRRTMEMAEEHLIDMLGRLAWPEEIWFVSDLPGKNLDQAGLGGGGRMAEALAAAIAGARQRITIQSPYLVLPEDAFGLYERLAAGVEVRISTNSLSSTDNIATFSGYLAQRRSLLDAGIHLREFRPDPAIEKELTERYLGPEDKAPIFVLHAKTVVVDGELLYVGTFNLDPRSVSLNTEEGIFLRHARLAQAVERQIEEEMRPENSWNPGLEKPERHAGWWRRVRVWFLGLLPIQSFL